MGFRARILAAFAVLGVFPLVITGGLGYVVSARLIEALASAHARVEVERQARILDRRSDLERSVSWPEEVSSPGLEVDRPLMRSFLVDKSRRRVAPLGKGAPTEAEASLALGAALDNGGQPMGDEIVSGGDGRWVVAHSALANDRWAVVCVGSLSQLTGLWTRARLAYAGFVVVVLLGIGAALTYLVRPIVRTLDDLTEATNLIGDGDLAPWLPARSGGEVGRLSLATGAMVDRVERMMRGVEQGARMAMVGQLATHLAHEIRNPLSSIKLNLQSLGRELAEGRIPTDVAEVTELCLHEIERLDRVATSVLQVGRARERRLAPDHLHASLRRAASVLGGEMSRRRISLYLDMLADRDDVFADRESMHSVFLNLLMNAAESIGEDGTIRVLTRNRLDEKGQAWIRIEVGDSGPGVPEHLRDRVFEPFYTTKPDGTGVGLATSLETVNAHGGSLSLALPTEQSAGATFVMELPLRSLDVSAPPPRKTHVESHPDHRG